MVLRTMYNEIMYVKCAFRFAYLQMSRLCAQCENGKFSAIRFRFGWQTGQLSFLLFVE